MYIHTYIHTYMYIHTYIHTIIHIYVNVPIHTFLNTFTHCHKLKKMTKNVDCFSATLCFKKSRGGRGCSTSLPTQFGVLETMPTQSGRGATYYGCSWYKHIVGSFCFCLSQLLSKEGEHCMCLIQSYKWPGKFLVPVSKLLEVILHTGKKARFGVQKVNDGQDICSRASSFGNGKHCQNMLSTLRVN